MSPQTSFTAWEKAVRGLEKKFPLKGGSELTVIVSKEGGHVDGFFFKEKAPDKAAEEDRPGTRLENWIDSLSPEALIEIIAKRDKSFPDISQQSNAAPTEKP
jgi:hypothetical protein